MNFGDQDELNEFVIIMPQVINGWWREKFVKV